MIQLSRAACGVGTELDVDNAPSPCCPHPLRQLAYRGVTVRVPCTRTIGAASTCRPVASMTTP
jgi:hypothetical protein